MPRRHGYLSELPAREYLPMFWAGAERALLQGTERASAPEEDARLTAEDFEEAVAPLAARHPGRLSPGAFTLERFRAAASWVASRAFGVDSFHGEAPGPSAFLPLEHYVGLGLCLLCSVCFLYGRDYPSLWHWRGESLGGKCAGLPRFGSAPAGALAQQQSVLGVSSHGKCFGNVLSPQPRHGAAEECVGGEVPDQACRSSRWRTSSTTRRPW